MPRAESPLFARTYDLLRWLIPLTVKFPREQRFVLAAALQQSALQMHERLIEASYSHPSVIIDKLIDVQVEVDKLRHYLRLSHDLELLTTGQYEHAAKSLLEVGRLLGGWRKSIGRGGIPGDPRTNQSPGSAPVE
ncbi:MAG: diversity-generating retroelement protein Avd [Ktedonobacterales bacterium]